MRNPETVIRYVVTHKPEKEGEPRVLSFAAQGRYTYATRGEAEKVRDVFLRPEGLPRVLTPAEVASVEVRSCECWAGHYDPVGIYFDDPEAS